MAEQFQNQGGAATMDPSRLYRWLVSRMMTRMSDPALYLVSDASSYTTGESIVVDGGPTI